ncbi:putative chitinase [Rhizobium sp. SG_E_25_P2]|uniref:hypothetical protein n=1 Tax=Rhizobium sp. SG_E_25_P2 TaxID=2879942 RepID=UPI0024747F0A|nr:hypothetical protein [Rhizobium sp. SG_E_25_P2]MDH6265551.1 putative chitinase [Rhizobium sp. SG_E_25_P2]
MDRSKLFDAVRDPLFGGRFTQPQVDGVDAILDAWDEQGLTDGRWLAYMLATAYHETGRAMAPVVENLNYSAVGLRKVFPKYFPTAEIAAAYARQPQRIANRAYANRIGNGDEASGDGWTFRGRGMVQLTGRRNYEIYGVANRPDIVLELDFSARILVLGMRDGVFTSRKLEQFITGARCDYVGARAIINGSDKAREIAAYARVFERGAAKAL